MADLHMVLQTPDPGLSHPGHCSHPGNKPLDGRSPCHSFKLTILKRKKKKKTQTDRKASGWTPEISFREAQTVIYTFPISSAPKLLFGDNLIFMYCKLTKRKGQLNNKEKSHR